MTKIGAGGVAIEVIHLGQRFKRDQRKLPRHVQQLIRDRLRDLRKDPRPPGLRFEKLKGHTNPDVYTVHITMNYKISMEIRGNEATLRRAGKHDEIDRCP